MWTALIQTSSGETSISAVRTREESITAVAAQANAYAQDVLLIALWLEDAVRGVERFTQIQVSGFLEVCDRLCHQVTGAWAGLWTRVKMGLYRWGVCWLV